MRSCAVRVVTASYRFAQFARVVTTCVVRIDAEQSDQSMRGKQSEEEGAKSSLDPAFMWDKIQLVPSYSAPIS